MADEFWAIVKPLRQQCLQPDRRAVERTYSAALNAARDVAHIQALFDHLRIAFLPWRHVFELLRLEAKLEKLDVSSLERTILGLRLRIAMRDYSGFLNRYSQHAYLGGLAHPAAWSRRFERLAEILSAPKFPDFSAPKIFGIGLSKSGTHSLNAALETLGLMSMHYSNEFSGLMLREEDAYITDAMTDTPVCVIFEKLYHRFENAKFVYTTRPREAWLDSFARHCRSAYGTEDFRLIRALPYRLSHHTYIGDFEMVDCMLYFRYRDVHEAFAAYDARVRHLFSDKPSARFLRLEIGDGNEWGRLAAFLNKEPPANPFPWENKSS